MRLKSLILIIGSMVALSLAIQDFQQSNGVIWADGMPTPSSTPSQSATSQPTLEMSSQEFEHWVAVKKREVDVAVGGVSPNVIGDATLGRLRDSRIVTDDAIISTVVSFLYSENRRSDRSATQKKLDYSDAIVFIEKVLPLISDRPILLAQLHQRIGHLQQIAEDNDKAKEEYEKTVSIITPEIEKLEYAKMEALVQIAGIYYAKRDKVKAEDWYLKALSLDWPTIEDAHIKQKIFGLYLEAGRGLIQCRRHNLKALKNTFFFPAAMEDLGPVLNAAILEAGGTVDSPRVVPPTQPASMPAK